MSWWVGKSRSEFQELSRTRNFSTKSRDNTISIGGVKNETMPARQRGRPRTSCYEAHKDAIKAYQNRLLAQGLCESGDGNKTEINPRTKKHYRRCSICAEKRSEADKRKRNGQTSLRTGTTR